MKQLSAVLLAGGESRRMGRDKATLTYKDGPLWRNRLEVLRKLEPVEIFVSARADPAWRPADAIFVADVPPSRGPLSGLAAALDRTSGTHLLALAVDMPEMTETYLRSLIERVEPGCGLLPSIGERMEPLAAVYPTNALRYFSEALKGEDFSLQGVARELMRMGRVSEWRVRPEDEHLFRNLNEPVA